MAKSKQYNKMIQSVRWRDLRARKLSQCPLCERCREAGLIEAATEVHHRDPCEMAVSDRDMEERMFNYNNLESLCHRCHVQRHIELRSKSKAVTRQRNERALQRFMEAFK